jgi:hypothetical protein
MTAVTAFSLFGGTPRWVVWINEPRGKEQKPTKVPYSPTRRGKAKADDRTWFKTHPNRAHRLRRALAGEAGHGMWIVVRQTAPGARQRVAFNPPPFEPADSEPLAHAIFDLLIKARAAGRNWVPGADIAERARMLARGGAT